MASISHVWMDGHPTRVYRSKNNTIPRKGWAAGDAARRAVQIALYVMAGQPGAPEALTSKPWGFLAQTFGDRGFEFPRPFDTWTIRNVLFKVMPVEGHGISAVEAALIQRQRMMDKGLPDPVRQIERIELRTSAAADLIINKDGPLQNAADRDHCIQYVVALALLKGSPPATTDYSNQSPWAVSADLAQLRRRISVRTDPRLTRDYLGLDQRSIGTGMKVVLVDGTILPEVLVEYPIGHVRDPRTKPALLTKFSCNMARLFSEREIAQILETVREMDTSVVSLVDMLARPMAKEKL